MQPTVAQLQQTIRFMEEQRLRVMEKRRRRVALIGGSVSLLLHMMLLLYLGLVSRGGGGGGSAGASTTYELAILNEEELTELEQTSFGEVTTEAVTVEQPAVETAALSAVAPATPSLSASAGGVPSLGGGGGGASGGDGGGEGGMGLGGGGAGTSFFGISSKGNRFAYIVDISGSMGDSRKLEIAKRELSRSIDALPDYSSFYVLLFSADFVQPPMQKGWSRARKPLVQQFISWLNMVDPGGGTAPRTSFMQVYSLELRPDVIYFLTDGQFQDISAEEIAEMNRRGKRAVINTIQFGDRNGEDLLRSIAKLTGGAYRFVPTESGP